jgi:hypothetical protein
MKFSLKYRILILSVLSVLFMLPTALLRAQPFIDSKLTNFVESSSAIQFDVQLKQGTGYVPGSPTAGDFTGLQLTWDFYIEPGVTVNMLGATSQINAAAALLGLTNSTPLIYSFPGTQSAGSTPGQKLRINIIRVSNTINPILNDLPAVYTTYATVTIPVTAGTPTYLSRVYQRTTTSSPQGGSFWGNSAPLSINNLPITTNAPGNGGAGTPLPVSLLEFSAMRASDGRRSQLDWTTATETGSAYFEVERSASGEASSFASIGVRVAAAGTSTSRLTYQTYDRAPLSGVNYYRLRVVDLSGKVGYSEVRSVRFDGQAAETVSFYPNPLTRSNSSATGLKVSVDADQSLSYSISDAAGKLVGGGSIEVLKGTGSYSLEGMESLSAGTYYLNVKGATLNQTLKISKAE